jgi:hypothetical protein
VIAGTETGGPGPVNSGVDEGYVPPQACEGDEYTVIVTYEIDAVTGEQLPTEIVIRQIAADGSVNELQLEGDLSGYRDLIAALEADGSCVEVEYVPLAEGEESAGEAPEAPEGAEEPGETPELVLP